MYRGRMYSPSSQVFPIASIMLVLLSMSNCEPNCTDIRLYNGKANNAEGRVEIFCDEQWGTISSNDTYVDLLICKSIGFGPKWKPNRTSEFGPGYGPVWNVKCVGQESSLQECYFYQNETLEDQSPFSELEYELFYNHDTDIGVKCRGQYTKDLSQNEKLHGDGNRKSESSDTRQEEISSNEKISTTVHDNSSTMIIVDVIGFTLILAAIALCGLLMNRKLSVTSYTLNKKEHSQAVISPNSHVTVQAEVIRQDRNQEGGRAHLEAGSSHGPALTEVNPVYQPATDMAENSSVKKRPEFIELTDTLGPALTEDNPCYEAAVDMTGASVEAQFDGKEAIDPVDIPVLTEENPCYEKY